MLTGNWAIVDRNNDHYSKGLSAIYAVLDCGYLRHPVYAAASLSMHPQVRRYFIGVVESYWDYTPVKPKTENGHVPLYLRSDSRFIGTAYKRAFYKQFTTSSFHEMRMRPEEERHLGFLGPLIRAEEGDVIEIVFQNMGSRPYSIHSHLVATDKANEGALYEDRTNVKSDDQVAPGSFQVYRWMVKQGPGSADHNCIASLYYSAVDAEVDAYSGLVGPLVICRKGTLGRDNKRMDVNKEFFLLFSVTDENRSWYLDSNVRAKAWERLGTNFHDKEFVESNRMPNINGFVQQDDIGLRVRQGDMVAWHVMGFGSSVDVHVVRLHGQPLVDHASDGISIFPEVGESVLMNATNPGTWSIHCGLGSGSSSGLETTLVVEPAKKSKK